MPAHTVVVCATSLIFILGVSRIMPHGRYAVRDFPVRADAIAGISVEVTFLADWSGNFMFDHDNCRGEGRHWMMVLPWATISR